MNDFGIDYYEYVAIIADNKAKKLNFEFERVSLQHDENLLMIENKILCEHGTCDDLTYLYTAEASETGKKKQGIIASLFNVILNLFKAIKEFLFGKKEPLRDIPENIQQREIILDRDPKEVCDETTKLFNTLKKAIGGTVAALVGGVVIKSTAKKIKNAFTGNKDKDKKEKKKITIKSCRHSVADFFERHDSTCKNLKPYVDRLEELKKKGLTNTDEYKDLKNYLDRIRENTTWFVRLCSKMHAAAYNNTSTDTSDKSGRTYLADPKKKKYPPSPLDLNQYDENGRRRRPIKRKNFEKKDKQTDTKQST